MVEGPHTLSDLELIAVVLAGGDGLAEAQRLLDSTGSLSVLARAGAGELRAIGHSSVPRICRLRAALELGKRALDQPLERGASIKGPDDVVERMRSRLILLEQEELHVFGLDTLNRLVVQFIAAVGSANQVFANPRDVFRPLVRESVQGAIVMHNHPSGSAEPSTADAELTVRLAESGAVLGISLLDHIIIARSGHYSFAQHHQLPLAK